MTNDVIGSTSEWTFGILNRGSAYWASKLVLFSPFFKAVFMEDMSTPHLSDWLSITLCKITHADDTALLHLRVVWIVSLLSKVNDSLYLRDSIQSLKVS